MAITPPEEYKNEFGYPGETASYEEIYFDGSLLYVFYYCNLNCVAIFFDPEINRPYFDENALVNINKNLETRQYIKNSGLSPSVYDAVLTDLGIERAVICKPLDYVDVVKDTGILQTENAIISYVPKDDRQKALFIAGLFNKVADVKKYSVPVVVLAIACWGEDITLKEFSKSAKTSKGLSTNLNNKFFITGQSDELFFSHERFILALRARRLTVGTAGDAVWVWFVNSLGGNERSALDKINDWDNKTSVYFKAEDKSKINSNAENNAKASTGRLNGLDSEISASISSLSKQINAEHRNRKGNNFFKVLIFDYDYRVTDEKLKTADNNVRQSEASKNIYKYSTARQQLSAASAALTESMIAKQQAEDILPTWWKVLLAIILILGVLYYFSEKAAIALGIVLLIIIFV